MPKKSPPSSTVPRKLRADAQRNRERILEVAKEAFTRDGATTSLDDIVRRSGVGPGTLYRHFPTRDDLIEAVYRSEAKPWTCSVWSWIASCDDVGFSMPASLER